VVLKFTKETQQNNQTETSRQNTDLKLANARLI